MRLPRLAAVAVLAAPLLTGCSLGGPDAGEYADRAAADLVSGRFDTPFATGADAVWKQASGDLGRPAKVTVGEVTTDGDKATATLHWTWDLRGHDWTYDSSLPLTRSGDAWQATLTPQAVHPDLTADTHLVATTVKAARGAITGARGQVIVEPREVSRIGLDKSALPKAQWADAARRLATALEIDPAAYVKLVRASGDKAFVQALVLRRNDNGIEWGSAGLSEGAVRDVPGVRLLSDHLPLAPTRTFAAPLLGTVGPATAEAIEKSQGRLRAGDDTGLSGLQQRYDEQLGGTSGVIVRVETGEPGPRGKELFEAAPVAGEPLALTLDVALQEKAERLLAGVGPASALVAIRPSTGAVLAAASGPGSKGYNTATFGQYAPGSTFKIVSSLALLRGGMTAASPVDCPPTLNVNGKSFKNYSDYPASSLGRITLGDAVAQSCNTAFIGSRAKAPVEALQKAAAALGLGVDADVGFPAYFGQVPDTDGETTAAADLIGQGTVLASPMAMATVIASVVQGSRVVPTLVDGVTPKTTEPAEPLTAQEATELRTMLRGVVERGSGRGLADLGDVIAKTGTAEFGDAGQTHAWMVAARGDLAVAAFVDVGESGSQTAGPILKGFLSGQ